MKENRKTTEKIITVFGSSRPKESDADFAEARELGENLAKAGFAVCSGGYGGVMEAVSRGAKEAGGKTYGVTAEFFTRKANEWVDVEVRKETWQERLFELIELADGFVACKGGTGTLVELAVVWEMLNKSVMPAKPFAGAWRILAANFAAGEGSGAGWTSIVRDANLGRSKQAIW